MRRSLPIVIATLVSLSGCSSSREVFPSLNLVERAKPTSKARDEKPITKIVCLWEPGVGRIPNGPTRGVLGQVLFFSGSDRKPQKVAGGAVVYLFDDHGSPEEQSTPVLKLVLTPKELEAVGTETVLGTAYQIPVPYPEKHRLETNCTMKVKYTSPSGQVTYSDLGTVLLEGTSRQSKAVTVSRTQQDIARPQDSESQPRQAGAAQIQRNSAGENNLRTLTIRRTSEPTRHSFRNRQSTRRTRSGPAESTLREFPNDSAPLSESDFSPPRD